MGRKGSFTRHELCLEAEANRVRTFCKKAPKDRFATAGSRKAVYRHRVRRLRYMDSRLCVIHVLPSS